MAIARQTVRYALPAKLGIDPRGIHNWLRRMEAQGVAIHAFQFRRHGQVFAEGAYEPYRLDGRHVLFSLSKSFTATAIGLAVQEGLLTVEDRVIDYFPEYSERLGRGMDKLTLRHLLTMNTGHETEPAIFGFKPNWSAYFLETDLTYEPGTHFLYNTAATYMLSAVISKVTGLSCHEYLRPRLYEPLGFDSDPWWEISPEGFSSGGFGLNLSVRDIGLFAQFCLQRGLWNNTQILPEAWFDEASHPWSDSSRGEYDPEDDWKQGYAYQFWRCTVKNVYRGDGALGQFAVILPDQDMALAITAGTYQTSHILKGLWEELLPYVGDGPLESSVELDAAEAELEQALAALTLWMPDYEDQASTIVDFLESIPVETVYELSENKRLVHALKITRDYLEFMAEGADWSRLSLDASCWTVGRLSIVGDPTLDLDGAKLGYRRQRSPGDDLPEEVAYQVHARQTAAGEHYLVVDMAFTATPTHERWVIRITDAGPVIEMEQVSGFSASKETVSIASKETVSSPSDRAHSDASD